MSDTPRTDAEPKHGGFQKELVQADFARQLERELGVRTIQAEAWRERAKSEHQTEAESLRGEISKLSDRCAYLEGRFQYWFKEATRARGEAQQLYRVVDGWPEAVKK